jgi:hypothetical protein
MGVRWAGRRGIGILAAVAVLGGVIGAVPPAAGAAPSPRAANTAPATQWSTSSDAARRALLFVVPGLAWRDLDGKDGKALPHLRRLTGESAVANLSSRAPKLRSDLTSGYVTLGAGNKAVGVGPTDDGSGLQPDGAAFEAREPVGGQAAGAVFGRRTGRPTDEGIVHLGIAETIGANRDSSFGAEVGALGDSLADAGWSRAVVANGDGTDTELANEVSDRRHRDAVAALMGHDGTVPAGAVGRQLLARDPAAPYGVRLDPARVEMAFAQQWRDRSVVLVEASDLIRADAYRAVSTPAHAREVRREALASADELAGRLLAHVDPARDAVIVLGTAPAKEDAALAVASVRAPGIEPGLLRSGTTQRAGFVQLMDVAPTVLDLVGLEPATSMRGRTMEVASTSGTATSRRAQLVDAEEAARFRARIVDQVAAAFIGLQCGLIAATLCSTTGVARKVGDAIVPALASSALAFGPAVYLARLLPLHQLGIAPYWAFLVLATIALAAIARLFARGRPLDALVLGLGTIVAVLVADGVTGSNLQLNSAFGFSPEVAGRFIGYGNAGYALLAAAALLLAGLLAHRLTPRFGARHAAWTAIAVLGIALVADGAPFWGADVGGVLSMVPAYGVAAVLLLGWKLRVRVRTVVAFGAATVVAIAGAAALDMQRPAGARTHLGRLVEQVRGEGPSAFTSVVQRKLEMNLASVSSSIWRILVPIALAFLAYLAFAGARPLRDVLRRIPPLASALAGFAVLLVVGYALNDTGIMVPALMLGILVPVIAVLIVERVGVATPSHPEAPELETV